MLIFVFSALIVLTDQFFKHWIVLTHDVGEETVLIPGVFSLFRLHNPGAAFGILANQPWWLLAAIQLFAAIVLVMIILRYTEGFWGSLGLASVLGGTVGNLIDRVFTFGTEFPHHVTDMFRFTFIDFAIFNIADVFITLGFLVFLIHFISLTFNPKEPLNRALVDGDDDEDVADDTAATPVAIDTAPLPAIDAAVVSPVTTDSAPLPVVDAATVTPVVADPAPLPVVSAAVVSPVTTDTAPLPVADAATIAPVADDIAPMLAFDALATPIDKDAAVGPDSSSATVTADSAPTPVVDAIVSQPGPVEIAPLLDHVYGGQYIAAAQKTGTTAPQAAPVASTQPIAKSLTPEPLLEPAAQTVAPVLQAETLPITSNAPSEAVSVAPTNEDNPEAMLNALSALETEILGEAESFDADKLLCEYGFESDDDDVQNNG